MFTVIPAKAGIHEGGRNAFFGRMDPCLRRGDKNGRVDKGDKPPVGKDEEGFVTKTDYYLYWRNCMNREPLVLEFQETGEYQPLLTGKPQTEGMRSGRVYLAPGESCQEHTTGAHEEQLVFLSGQGRALCGKEKTPYEVGVGKVLYIPPHTLHTIFNSGTEPLVYIYCVTPIS